MWLMQIVEHDTADPTHLLRLAIGDVETSYLEAFDANAFGGRGLIMRTLDPMRAKRFASVEAVMACWKTQSTLVPLRDDGRPNRPLTAFTIQPVETVDDNDPDA